MRFRLLIWIMIEMAIILNLLQKRHPTQVYYKYRVVNVYSNLLEVVMSDITHLQKGTFPGYYTCDTPISSYCTVTVDSNSPDGYLDPPTNSRPYFIRDGAKVITYENGVFNYH